jgi:tRNA(Arg) A34 adenosine deaminase TadA
MNNEYFMPVAIESAKKGDFPYGAVIVLIIVVGARYLTAPTCVFPFTPYSATSHA